MIVDETAPRQSVAEVGSPLLETAIALRPSSLALGNKQGVPDDSDEGDESYEEYEEYEEEDPNVPGTTSNTGGTSPATSNKIPASWRNMIVEGFIAFNALLLVGAGLSLPRRIAHLEKKAAPRGERPAETSPVQEPPDHDEDHGDARGGTNGRGRV